MLKGPYINQGHMFGDAAPTWADYTLVEWNYLTIQKHQCEVSPEFLGPNGFRGLKAHCCR